LNIGTTADDYTSWNGTGAVPALAIQHDNSVVAGATNAATSKTVAAFTVAGGIGISGTIYAGLANATAIDDVCYSSVTGLFTYTVTATACVVSDENAKDEMTPIDPQYALNVVLGSTPISFIYKPERKLGNDRHLGFGAQSLERIAPELVTTTNNGKDKAIKQKEMSPYAWAAIKRLKAEFDEYRRIHP